LERIGSGERRSFASLQALFEYLVETTHNLTGAEERSVDGQNHEIEP
jgi:hypothetical protein